VRALVEVLGLRSTGDTGVSIRTTFALRIANWRIISEFYPSTNPVSSLWALPMSPLNSPSDWRIMLLILFTDVSLHRERWPIPAHIQTLVFDTASSRSVNITHHAERRARSPGEMGADRIPVRKCLCRWPEVQLRRSRHPDA
jgi:hypothetical protein